MKQSKKGNRWQLIMVMISFMFGMSLFGAALPQKNNSGEPMPKGLWKAYSEARHMVEKNKDTKEGCAYKAYNPKNRYGIRYGEKGLKLQSGSWEFAMELQAYGQEKNLKPVAKAKLNTKGNKVTFDRGIVSEWYINDSKGLEQGFTLNQPKVYDKTKELILSLSLEGGLTPQWKSEGQSVSFFKDKTKAFDYEKLKAFDASGKILPAHLALVDNTLQIRVDAKGAQWPVTVDPIFATEQKVVGVTSDAEIDDEFGYAVDLNGNTALIGASYNDDDYSNSGSAYVMVETASGWVIQAKLTASDAAAEKHFGSAVALHGDMAVVGAYGDDSSGSDSGSAYVFIRSGSTWSEEAKLTASNGVADDKFGTSVALDGSTIVIGAPYADAEGADTGSAYVFVRSGVTWSEEAILPNSNGEDGEQFGTSVAISGETVLIGSPLDNCASGLCEGAAFVFIRSGTTWSEEAKLTASEGAANDGFGFAISLEGDTAVAGAYGNDDVADNSGAAYVFTRLGSTWSQQAKLTASDAAEDDYFGRAVALDSDTILVGAHYDDDGSSNSGSAYLFTRSGTVWSQQSKLTASDAAENDYFGRAVALDGDIAVLGVPFDDDGGSNSGSAYIFTRSGSTWSQQAKLTASDVNMADEFGISAALDGNTALIGAHYDDDGGENSGSAYVFTRSGTTWSQQAKLTASDGADVDRFGYSVALDSDTALVGAYGDDDDGTSSGSAYIFTRSGTAWSQQVKLTASDGETADRFGFSVALDSDTALVGAYSSDNVDGINTGSAYIFTGSGTTWSQQAKLTASDGAAADSFGYSVALDGETALIGAYDNNGAGAAYIFTRSGTAWSQQAKLTALDAVSGDAFGISVALDGDTVFAGAFSADNGINSGSAYIFTRSGIVWSQQAKLTASDAAEHDYFGQAAALDGDTILVGAYGDDDSGSNSGSAYIFTRSGSTWRQQAKLAALDAVSGDEFGYSVALDGDTALVGAYHDDNGVLDSGSAYFNRFECGFAGSILADRWTMVGLPCDTGTTDTVEEIFGDTLDPNDYYYRWVVYQRNETSGYYERLDLGSVLTHGRGYWLKSMDQSYWDTTGTLTQYPVTTGCADPEGCFEYSLETPATAGEFQYNLVGFPANTKRVWSGARFMVDGTSYTPAQAEGEGLVSKTIWTWNGNSYNTYDDSTPGMEGELDSHEAFWVKVLDGAVGSTVKILIPANSVIGTPPPPPSM